MNLIDWRELYAANRAVIEGRAAPVAPTATTATASPAITAARSAGRWERIAPGGRAVHVYTPPGLGGDGAPLVVMLHGCTQTPASFSAGTAMNALADAHGVVVAYPEQTREDNQQGCWNWFLSGHQGRDAGEPASIAAAVRTVVDRWTIDPRRVYAAGLSAGGAMAGIMAATHPDLFAAVAVHSGLGFRSARTLPSAMNAMRGGGDDPEAMGAAAHAAMGAHARPVPALVIHGRADSVVAPVNGEQVARQWLAANRLASGGGFEGDWARPDESFGERDGGRDVSVRRWADRSGRLLTELIEVEGLGHAWSGGAPGAAYADPHGPSASETIWRFFERSRI